MTDIAGSTLLECEFTSQGGVFTNRLQKLGGDYELRHVRPFHQSVRVAQFDAYPKSLLR